jgi:hypothetical protein
VGARTGAGRAVARTVSPDHCSAPTAEAGTPYSPVQRCRDAQRASAHRVQAEQPSLILVHRGKLGGRGVGGLDPRGRAAVDHQARPIGEPGEAVRGISGRGDRRPSSARTAGSHLDDVRREVEPDDVVAFQPRLESDVSTARRAPPPAGVVALAPKRRERPHRRDVLECRMMVMVMDKVVVVWRVVLTAGRAQQIRGWRVDQELTWRGVAAAASAEWKLDHGANQLHGMELCEAAAQLLGEDPNDALRNWSSTSADDTRTVRIDLDVRSCRRLIVHRDARSCR